MPVIVENNSINWKEKYTSLLQKFKVPGTTSTSVFGNQYIYRDLVVNFDSVLNTLTSLNTQPSVVFVIADVVYFPGKEFELRKNQGFIIIARRLICDSRKEITFNSSERNAAFLTFFIGEVCDSISVKLIYDKGRGRSSHYIYPRTGLGCHFTQDPTTLWPKSKEVGYAQLSPFISGGKQEHISAEIKMALSCFYQIASYQMDMDKEHAHGLLSWIKTVASNSLYLQDLYVQSATLLTQLNLERSHINYVPSLSTKVYENLADGFMGALREYEIQYRIFAQDSTSKADQIRAGKLMLDNYKASTEFTEGLIAQAELNFSSAEATLKAASKSLEKATWQSEAAARDFKIGVKIWEHDQRLKAAFEMCSALVGFGICIGKLCMGDATAAAGAGGAVADAGKAVAAAKKAGEELSAFATAMANLEKAMNSLKKMGELLEGTVKFIGKIAEVAKKLDGALHIGDVSIPSSDDISGQAEWDIFRLQSEDLLKLVEEEGIGGASAYRQALVIVSIFGKAQSAAQASLLQCGQELARLLMQKKANIAMEASVKKYLESLDSDIVADQRALHEVFALQMNMKRFMFNAVRSYTQAYKYWALKESLVKPSLDKSCADMQVDLASMKRDYFDALQNFRPAPQDFGEKNDGIEIEITDANIIRSFIENGIANISIPIDSPEFSGMERVRITLVRAWIYGLKFEKAVTVHIVSSGRYTDRFKKNVFTFGSQSSGLLFKYNLEPGNVKGIVIDGAIASEFRGAYFQPTPFTEWRISLPPEDNKGADRSAVTKICLRFSGSVVGNVQAKRKIATTEPIIL